MGEVTGIVEDIKQRATNYGVKVGGTWYGGRGKAPCAIGQRVEFDASKNEAGFLDLRDMHLLEDLPKCDPARIIIPAAATKDDVIIREVAVKAAAEICSRKDPCSTNMVLDVAEDFAAWIKTGVRVSE